MLDVVLGSAEPKAWESHQRRKASPSAAPAEFDLPNPLMAPPTFLVFLA